MASTTRERRLRRNLPLLCGFRALQMTLFPVAVITLFMTAHLGLTLTDVFILQALFSLFTALLEFPGGYVADRIGYRRSMLLACGASMAGWCVYSFAASFEVIVVAELLLATSLALTSGTDTALMYESLVELDEESSFARWLGRSRSLGAVSEGSAALAAGVMFAFDPRLPLYAQTLVWIPNAVIVLLLVEPQRARAAPQRAWAHARELLHFAASRSPRLRATIVTQVALGLSTFAPVWIIAVYAERAGLAVVWIGPLWAVANYAVALGNITSDRWERSRGLHATLLGSVLLVALGYAGLGLTHAVFGFVFYYAICMGRGLASPVLNHAQQRLIPSSDRAALLSINSLLFRASFAILGPVFGIAFDTWGEHAVLGAMGTLFLAASLASLSWLRTQPQPDGPPRIERAPTTAGE